MINQTLRNTTLALGAAFTFQLCTALAQEPAAEPTAKDGGTTMKADASASPAMEEKTEKPAKEVKDKTKPLPFRGIIASVDKANKSFVVKGKKAERTFRLTDTSKVMKGEAAGSADDLVAGDMVHGSAMRIDRGKFDVISVSVGPAPSAKAAASAKPGAKK